MNDCQTVSWVEDGMTGKLRLLDQTRLPEEEVYVELDDAVEIFDAIKRLVVRGAPAIGCAAALGLAAVAGRSRQEAADEFIDEVRQTARYLESSRPTAVNLAWALQRCLRRLQGVRDSGQTKVSTLRELLVAEAKAVLEEDRKMCQAIGQHGLALFEGKANQRILTHCNAGALATGGCGTALAPIYAALDCGLAPLVFADETRPLLQGARLTAWELQKAGVDVTVLCDNMAAQVMREGRIDFIIVGADRIAANGDVANKIGTYGVAVLAAHHRVPFYVAAPYSTIDRALASGEEIPIEQRDAAEVVFGFGRRTAPAGCAVYNPAFDVTPAELITGIVTEQGILRPPYDKSIARLFQVD